MGISLPKATLEKVVHPQLQCETVNFMLTDFIEALFYLADLCCSPLPTSPTVWQSNQPVLGKSGWGLGCLWHAVALGNWRILPLECLTGELGIRKPLFPAWRKGFPEIAYFLAFFVFALNVFVLEKFLYMQE